MSLRSRLNNSGILGKTLLVRRSSNQAVKQFMRKVSPLVTEHSLIRVGGNGDGGYLVPDDLEGVSAIFSPGVADTAGFEAEFAQRGIHCFLADHSVNAPPINSPLIHFEKKYLGPLSGGIYTSLDDWVERNASKGSDLVLQMDIEGAEYQVLLAADQATLRRFRIMVIEFHSLESVWNPKGLEMIEITMTKLLNHFDVVHAHPNNCRQPIGYGGLMVPPLIEFTFLRKDRIHSRTPVESLPHPLDQKNVPNLPDLSLPQCWYR